MIGKIKKPELELSLCAHVFVEWGGQTFYVGNRTAYCIVFTGSIYLEETAQSTVPIFKELYCIEQQEESKDRIR